MSSVSDQDAKIARSQTRKGGSVALAARLGARLPRVGRYDRPTWAEAAADAVLPSRGLRDVILDFALDALAMRRVQLVGAFVLAVLLPMIVRWRLDLLRLAPRGDLTSLGNLSLTNAVVGTAAAMVLGYVIMRQMRAHPGVRSIGYVVYAFAMTYGALGLAFLFVRADYSRYQILCSGMVAVLWFAFVDQVTARRTVWRLAFLPGVPASALPRAPRVFWRPLTAPDQSLAGLTGVVADLRAELSSDWERLLAHCALQGLPVYDVRQVSEWLTGKVKVQHLSENTLSSGLARMVYVRVKRLVDIFGVALAIVPFGLAIGVAALLIKLESPGPAFFLQRRMGHRGRPFTMCKLRSMRQDAPAAGQAFTAENDPRITRVGAFIRKYRIDEFPQIWNILKGEMSWIGPRPEAAPLADLYDREVPFYCYRHMVRPGITGWAQVHQGNVAMVDAATEKLHYDFYYIKNLSPWLDLLIGAKTLLTIFTGFGAR